MLKQHNIFNNISFNFRINVLYVLCDVCFVPHHFFLTLFTHFSHNSFFKMLIFKPNDWFVKRFVVLFSMIMLDYNSHERKTKQFQIEFAQLFIIFCVKMNYF